MKKRITIYDIAKETGFSVGTVNRALNNKPRIQNSTKKLILDTANQLGYKANAAAQGLRRTPITIGAILFCPIDEYVDAIIDGISSSQEDLEKYNVTIDLRKLEYSTGRKCIEQTIDLIKCFEQNNYNGIILFMSSMIEEMCELSLLIDKLFEKNIFVATLANDIPKSKRIFHVGVNAYMAGKMAAEMLELSCKNESVAMFVTSTSSPINLEYINGFNDYAQKGIFSNIKIYEHFDDKEKIIDTINCMLDENPDLKGIYMSTAGSGIACEYLKSINKKDLSIITTDLLKETPSLLKQKIATATIFQNPYKQGRDCVKLLYNHIIGKSVSEMHFISPQILLSANVESYQN